MSGGGDINTPEEDLEHDHVENYKPPPEKTIEEILAADQEDESLRKYKETLLGQAQIGTIVVGKLILFQLIYENKFMLNCYRAG